MMITVALPVYKRKSIAWVALESLSKQMTSQSWELIVCEEIHEDQCGRDYFFKYKESLFNAGCQKITYIELSEWINLPEKWRIMANRAEGEIFLLQASDSWSDPERLERSHQILQDYDWTNDTITHFFEVQTGRMAMFDLSTHKAKKNAVGIACGMKTGMLKTLPQSTFIKGIDGFMYDHLAKQNARFYKEERLFSTMEFQGVNNITAHRSIFFDNPQPPYHRAILKAEDIVPFDVIERVKNIQPENHVFMERKVRFNQDWNKWNKDGVYSLPGPVVSFLIKKGIADYIIPEQKVYYEQKPQTNENSNDKSIRRNIPKRAGNRSARPNGKGSVKK